MQDLRFSQQSCWTSSSWSPEGQQSLWVKHYMTAWPWIYKNQDPSKRLKLSTQWHSIVSQKTWLFNELQFQWAGTSRMNVKSLSAVCTKHQLLLYSTAVTQAAHTECALWFSIYCTALSVHYQVQNTASAWQLGWPGGGLPKRTKYWGKEVKAQTDRQTPCSGVQCP
jgi:hypothetical protein